MSVTGALLSPGVLFKARRPVLPRFPRQPDGLFADGTDGALVDPNQGVMFKDVSATDPASPGDNVAFTLDPSRGAGYSGGQFTGAEPAIAISSWINHAGSSAWDIFSNTGSAFTGEKTASGGTDLAYSNLVVSGVAVGDFYLTIVAVTSATVARISARLSSASNSRSTHATFSSPAVGNNAALVMADTVSGDFSLAVSTTDVGAISVSGASLRKVPGHHAMQASTSKQPALVDQGDGNLAFRFDGVDDAMVQIMPDGLNGDVMILGTDGSWIDTGVTVAPGGTLTVINGPDSVSTPGIIPALGDIVGWIALDRTITAQEREDLLNYYAARGAKGLLGPTGANYAQWTGGLVDGTEYVRTGGTGEFQMLSFTVSNAVSPTSRLRVYTTDSSMNVYIESSGYYELIYNGNAQLRMSPHDGVSVAVSDVLLQTLVPQ